MMSGKVWLLLVIMVASGVAARADPPPPPPGPPPPARTPAAPPTTALSALKNFNLTLLRMHDRHVDPSRVVPRAMLSAILDSVQREIPEMLVEPDGSADRLAITVGDKRMIFEAGDVETLFRLASMVKRIFRFVEASWAGSGADAARVEYAAINAMLSTLDAHSVAIAPMTIRAAGAPASVPPGEWGLSFRPIDHELLVTRVMPRGPASRAGIRPLDRIVRIDDQRVDQMTGEDLFNQNEGPIGSRATLWIKRAGSHDPLRFEVTRAFVQKAPVTLQRLQNGVSVLRVDEFSKSVARTVAAAMALPSSVGTRAWVLDLRGCPGGLLEEAAQIADLFLARGALVTTESRSSREVRQAQRGADDISTPLVVLVDGETVAGAEIVAAALADLDRAVILGERTSGSGTLQELFTNDDGGMVKLTMAHWLTPNGRSVQAVGVVPDIVLHRISVPAQNQSPDDEVHLLGPSRASGEAALANHLTSTHASDTQPAFEIALPPRKPASGVDADIADDGELAVAVEIAAAAKSATRSGLLREARSTVAAIQAREEQQLIASLRPLGVDWSAPPANAGGSAALDIALALAPAAEVHAGDVVTITATAKNTGTVPAWRVLVRLHCDDDAFDDRELPIGKLEPGETRTFTTAIEVPREAFARVDRITAEVREARGARATPAPIRVRIHAASPPATASSGQLAAPSLALSAGALETSADRYALQGTATDETGVADVAILVSNRSAGVRGKKVYYRSSAKPGAPHRMDFEASLPLWPGSNEVTVQTRNTSHATAKQTIVVGRHATP
jgi:carboxyl-terminal processing protease